MSVRRLQIAFYREESYFILRLGKTFSREDMNVSRKGGEKEWSKDPKLKD